MPKLLKNVEGKIFDSYTTNVTYVSSVTGEVQQEDYINATGGRVGARLFKIVKNKSYLMQVSRPEILTPSYYLNHTEDFRDRLVFEASDGFKGSMDYSGVFVTSLQRNLSGCDVTVFIENGVGKRRYSRLRFQDRSFKKGSRTFFNLPAGKASRARVFINECEQGPDEQFAVRIGVGA
jgi:hypothetical protein